MHNQEEDFYRAARRCAQVQGLQLGLNGDGLEDCAQTFVVKLALRRMDPPIWTWHNVRRDRYLQRASRNHAINFLRDSVIHHRAHAANCTDITLRNVQAGDTESHPAARLFMNLFWEEIMSALNGLSPLQRTLVVDFHIREASIGELAAANGCNHHAIHGLLSYARKRLREKLLDRGYTAQELRSYLPAHQPSVVVAGVSNPSKSNRESS